MKRLRFNGQMKFAAGRVYLSGFLLLAFGLHLTHAFADEGDFYVGGGPVFSFLDPDTGNIRFPVEDDTDIGGKLFLGYDFTRHWTLEGFYAIPGEARIAPQRTIEYDALYGLGGMFSWPHNQQGLSGFFKAGGAGLDVESANISLKEENDVQLFLGAGGRYNFGQGWGVRLEYEHFSGDVQLITLSVIKRFGIGGGKPEAKDTAVAPPAAPEPGQAMSQVLDSDGDGVDNTVDACPATPQGTRVGADGCPVFGGTLPSVQFKMRSDAITSSAASTLDEVARILQQHPDVKIEIQGHTCEIGSLAYNQNLSEQRARSAADYLLSRGIDANRMRMQGFGETRPIASNANETGRAQNRRCEIVVTDR